MTNFSHSRQVALFVALSAATAHIALNRDNSSHSDSGRLGLVIIAAAACTCIHVLALVARRSTSSLADSATATTAAAATTMTILMIIIMRRCGRCRLFHLHNCQHCHDSVVVNELGLLSPCLPMPVRPSWCANNRAQRDEQTSRRQGGKRARRDTRPETKE